MKNWQVCYNTESYSSPLAWVTAGIYRAKTGPNALARALGELRTTVAIPRGTIANVKKNELVSVFIGLASYGRPKFAGVVLDDDSLDVKD